MTGVFGFLAEPVAALAEFEALGQHAGFASVRLARIPLDRFAREAGVPAEHLPRFAGPGAPLLLARKRSASDHPLSR